MRIQTRFAATVGCLVLLTSTAAAFNINLVYPSGTLFSTTYDDAAKNAISAAAFDISTAITTNLAAINTDVYTGTSGSNSVTYNWRYKYLNPQIAGNNVYIETATIATNTVTLYVGARNLAGSTLGEGGFAVLEGSFNYSWSNAGQLPAAAASANSQSQLAYKRGGGPVLGSLVSSKEIEGVTVNTSVDYGVAYGSLALDWDGSGDGGWHFNHQTDVAFGKSDLYSVALHEMLHALGIGSSDTWDSKVSGTNWTGTNVINLNNGSGVGLIDGDSSHIAELTMSTNAYDGSPQEAAMTPSIGTGKRKELTALDLAFLRDIGYNTINWVTPSFSPADFNTDGYVDATDLAMWQGAYGATAAGDADDDGDTDGRDFLIWQREYGVGPLLAASTTVPEPSTTMLIGLCGVALLGRRRGTR